MAESTGGFWSSTGGQILGGVGAALGLGPLFDTAMNREMTANENDLSRLHDIYMAGVSQNNALQQMRVQHGYETRRYQDLVKDMEAAGLNPASAFGSSAASAPSSNTVGASAAHSSALGYNSSTNTSLVESLFNAMVSNSKDARRVASQEMLDNARHEHKMEEINEMKQIFGSKASKERSMADYMAEWEANKKRFAK